MQAKETSGHGEQHRSAGAGEGPALSQPRGLSGWTASALIAAPAPLTPVLPTPADGGASAGLSMGGGGGGGAVAVVGSAAGDRPAGGASWLKSVNSRICTKSTGASSLSSETRQPPSICAPPIPPAVRAEDPAIARCQDAVARPQGVVGAQEGERGVRTASPVRMARPLVLGKSTGTRLSASVSIIFGSPRARTARGPPARGRSGRDCLR